MAALASGLTWAATVMGLRWLGRRSDDPTATQPSLVAGNVLACVLTLGLALPVEHMPARDLAILAFLGVIQIGLAYVCLVAGIRGVPALEASLLLLLEPVLNPIWAWLVHGEAPGHWALVGGAIIMVATTARTAWDARQLRPTSLTGLINHDRPASVPERLDLLPLGRHRVDGRLDVAGRAGHLTRPLGDDGGGDEPIEVGAQRGAAIGGDARAQVPGQRGVPGAVGVAQGSRRGRQPVAGRGRTRAAGEAPPPSDR